MRKLFSVDPARIGRFEGPPKSDAVDASLVDGKPADLKADLIALLGKEKVRHRAIDLVRYASDASPYRLVPGWWCWLELPMTSSRSSLLPRDRTARDVSGRPAPVSTVNRYPTTS